MKNRHRKLAEAGQRKPHWVMEEAINPYVEREEKRQVFHDDARKAWAEYQTTSLHVAGEEVSGLRRGARTMRMRRLNATGNLCQAARFARFLAGRRGHRVAVSRVSQPASGLADNRAADSASY